MLDLTLESQSSEEVGGGGGGGSVAVVGGQLVAGSVGPGKRFALDDRANVHHLRDFGVAPDHGAGPRVADGRAEGGVARVPGGQERHERDHEGAPVFAAHGAVQHEVGRGVHHHEEVEYGVQAAVHVVRGRLLGRLVHGRRQHHHGRRRLAHAEHDHHRDQCHGHLVLLPLPVPHHVSLRTRTRDPSRILERRASVATTGTA